MANKINILTIDKLKCQIEAVMFVNLVAYINMISYSKIKIIKTFIKLYE